MERILTSRGYINELCRLFKKYRLEYPLTQQELADRTGLSLRSIQNFESGKDIKLDSFIRLLMEVDLDHNLSMLIPDIDKRPSIQLEREKGKKKQRVRHPKKQTVRNFKWGDES